MPTSEDKTVEPSRLQLVHFLSLGGYGGHDRVDENSIAEKKMQTRCDTMKRDIKRCIDATGKF